MFILYDTNHIKVCALTDYKDYHIEQATNLDDLLYFSYPIGGLNYSRLHFECYIQDGTNEYIIKEINVQGSSSGVEWVQVVCKINLEDLKGHALASINSTGLAMDVADLALVGTGWTVGFSDVTTIRTVLMTQCSTYDVISEIAKAYRCEITYSAILKSVIIHKKQGANRGAYFAEQLNLTNLQVQGHTNDYVTRLIPIGQNGLGIAGVNGGLNYVSDYQYSNKVITEYWLDNRYIDAQALMADAINRLSYLSKPTKAYSADIIDLAKVSTEWGVLDFALGDFITLLSESKNIRELQRIIKIDRYPEEPERSTIEIANRVASLVDIILTVTDASDVVGGMTNTAGEVLAPSVSGQLSNAFIATANVGTLDATIANIGALLATKALITDLTAINANITNLTANKANVTDLTAATGRIGILEVNSATITQLNATNASITNLSTVYATISNLTATNANVTNLTTSKANVTDLTATTARVTTLETNSATITQLNATNASITNLSTVYATITNLTATNADVANLVATKATIIDLTAANANITILTTDVASINTLLAGNIGAANLAAGAIQAGSAVIAVGAIGSAQISDLTAGKLTAGIIDTALVTIQGTNGRLKISGNRLQVFAGATPYERVALGDVNGDGTNYGLRVRGADGTTILLDENGVRREGVTDGSINNAKIGTDANISGAKLDIASVVTSINGGTTTIQGSKVFLNDSTLDVQFSTLNTTVTNQGTTITSQGSSITALNNSIVLKVETSTYTTKMTNLDGSISNINTSLGAQSSSISILQDQIVSKVTQTDVDTSINAIQVGGRNLLINSAVEKTSTREFLVYADLAPIFDLYGLVEYTISFDIKSMDITNRNTMQVYMQNGSGARYNFSASVPVTTMYTRHSITVIPTLSNIELTLSMLAFYGTYDTGNIPAVKNVKVEKGNKATDWTPAPEDVQSQLDATNTNITNNYSTITQTATNLGLAVSGINTNLSNNYSTTTAMNSAIAISKDAINLSVSGTYATITNLGKKVDTTTYESYISVTAGQIATKVDVNGVKSTIEQYPDSVRIGFNKINSAKVTIDTTGLHVTGGSVDGTIISASSDLKVSSNVWNSGTSNGITMGGVITNYDPPVTFRYVQGLSGDGTSCMTILGTGSTRIALQSANEIDLRGDVYVTGDLSTSGQLKTNYAVNSAIGKIISQDASWVRINDTGSSSAGIYCGHSILRTDGELQVGGSGSSFRATSGGSVYVSGLVSIGGTTYTNNILCATTAYTDRLSGYSNTNLTYFGNDPCHIDTTIAGVNTMRLYTTVYDASGATDTGIAYNSSGCQFKIANVTKFKVNPDGSKIGGVIEIDGMNVGLSPVDSPRCLHQDILTDVQVMEEGTTVFLDSLFAKSMAGYAVFPNNGKASISDKTADSFRVTGVTGLVDFNIIGNRRDKTEQYFEIMTDVTNQ